MYNKRIEFDSFENAKIFTKNLFANNDFVHNYSLSVSRDENWAEINQNLQKLIEKKGYDWVNRLLLLEIDR